MLIYEKCILAGFKSVSFVVFDRLLYPFTNVVKENIFYLPNLHAQTNVSSQDRF